MKSVRVDGARNLVFVEYSGVVIDADLMVGVDEYKDLGASFSVLINLSRVHDFRITPEALRRVARTSSGSRARSRCALIAPTPVAFGLARMYEVLCESEVGDTTVRVFRDEVSAYQWLESARVSPRPSPA